MKTKFGNASLCNLGYYIIVSSKEGNYCKKLHRLIFEDFYGCEIPKGYEIHHKNGDKTDNCILNLQMLSKGEHASLHRKGSVFSEESVMNLCRERNTSGYFRVYKHSCSTCKQGFIWRYVYRDGKKYKTIQSISLEKLREKVLTKGLHWEVLSEEAT